MAQSLRNSCPLAATSVHQKKRFLLGITSCLSNALHELPILKELMIKKRQEVVFSHYITRIFTFGFLIVSYLAARWHESRNSEIIDSVVGEFSFQFCVKTTTVKKSREIMVRNSKNC